MFHMIDPPGQPASSLLPDMKAALHVGPHGSAFLVEPEISHMELPVLPVGSPRQIQLHDLINRDVLQLRELPPLPHAST